MLGFRGASRYYSERYRAGFALECRAIRKVREEIGLDNVAGGLAGTCLIAYMSSLTSVGFTATQYALFSSLYAIPGRLIASQSGRIVEGAARLAEAGGMLSGLAALVAAQAPQNFASAVQRSGVSPAALGTGYIVFFGYSAAIGVFALALALLVQRAGVDAGAIRRANGESTDDSEN